MHIRTAKIRQLEDTEEVNKFIKEFADYIIKEEIKLLKEIIKSVKEFLKSQNSKRATRSKFSFNFKSNLLLTKTKKAPIHRMVKFYK